MKLLNYYDYLAVPIKEDKLFWDIRCEEDELFLNKVYTTGSGKGRRLMLRTGDSLDTITCEDMPELTRDNFRFEIELSDNDIDKINKLIVFSTKTLAQLIQSIPLVDTGGKEQIVTHIRGRCYKETRYNRDNLDLAKTGNYVYNEKKYAINIKFAHQIVSEYYPFLDNVDYVITKGRFYTTPERIDNFYNTIGGTLVSAGTEVFIIDIDGNRHEYHGLTMETPYDVLNRVKDIIRKIQES